MLNLFGRKAALVDMIKLITIILFIANLIGCGFYIVAEYE